MGVNDFAVMLAKNTLAQKLQNHEKPAPIIAANLQDVINSSKSSAETLLALSPIEIARQISLNEFELYNCIQPNECLGNPALKQFFICSCWCNFDANNLNFRATKIIRSKLESKRCQKECSQCSGAYDSIQPY